MQTFDGEAVVDLIKKLVVLDGEWIPKEKGYSLYLRESIREARSCHSWMGEIRPYVDWDADCFGRRAVQRRFAFCHLLSGESNPAPVDIAY